jgi:hypothetical protein
MKKHILFPVAAVLFIMVCSTGTVKVTLEGTWILVKSTIITPEDTINLPATENAVHMKIIGKTHFATIWQDPNVENYAGFNGGTYTFENGIYTENLQFSRNRANIGWIVPFRVTLEKDRFFMESVDDEGNKPEFKISEEWKRAD